MSNYRERSLEHIAPDKWLAYDNRQRYVWVRYTPPTLTMERDRRFRKPRPLLRENVGDAFGDTLPVWYVESVIRAVLRRPRSPSFVDTHTAKRLH